MMKEPILGLELGVAIKETVTGNSPGPDGLIFSQLENHFLKVYKSLTYG